MAQLDFSSITTNGPGTSSAPPSLDFSSITANGPGTSSAPPALDFSKITESGVFPSSSTNKSLSSLTDPSIARRSVAGLASGAADTASANSVQWLNSSGQVQSAGSSGEDWRLRVSVSPTSNILYLDGNNDLLNPLQDTNGVIFPITPNINVTNSARYSMVSPTHSNYAFQFYEGSEASEIQINGEFPIQNNAEGSYLLAVIYFFRAATKMFWGQEENAGSPPPLLYLDGYGTHYFPHVPCVLKNFTHTLPQDVDYIEISPWGAAPGETTRLPTESQVQIILQPTYSRTRITTFTQSDFARGKLLSGGFI